MAIRWSGRQVVVLGEREVTAEHLRAVFDHELLAIQIRNLIPPTDRNRINDFARQHLDMRGYSVEPRFQLLGRARFEGTDGPEALEAYFQHGLGVMRRVADGIAPATPPWVRILALLNEVWPTGAVFQRFGGRMGQVGLLRVVQKSGRVLGHQDMAIWDDPHDRDIAKFTGVASMVTYLCMPESGGEIGLHGAGFTDPAEYAEYRVPGSQYAVDTAAIQSEPVWLRPEEGDAVIFASDLIHEVAPVLEGLRATVSLFAVRKGAADPLGLFS